jgi:Toprim domain/CHC2 zinc finger
MTRRDPTLNGAIEQAREIDILGLAERLGAKLKRIASNEWAGPCQRAGGRDSFSINARKKIFNCRRCAIGGDAIGMVEHIAGSSFVEAVKFITGEAAANTGEDVDYHRGDPKGEAAAEPNHDAFVAKRIASIVRELVPVSRSPGGLYFQEARAIDTDLIADILERTDAIGWHPSVLFREEGHSLDGERLGCIVGVMTDPVTAKPTGAISRTYLHEGLKVGKAKTLGSPVGIVRLSADEDVVEGLCLAEGLETCLGAMAKGFRPCWSTGSAGVMAGLPVLAGVEALTLLADNDASGTGVRAANETSVRWRAAGREAHIYLREVLGDFNDVLMETRR